MAMTTREAQRHIGERVLYTSPVTRQMSGFGVIVSADEILPHWHALKGPVTINGDGVRECSTAGARFSLGEVLAHASRDEQLHPGELFGSGTLVGGSGIESDILLKRGDTVSLSIDGIGAVTNRIV